MEGAGREGCSGRGCALAGLTPVCGGGRGPACGAAPTLPCSPGNPRAKTPSGARTSSVTAGVWPWPGLPSAAGVRGAARLARALSSAWLPGGSRPWAPSREGAGSGGQDDGSEGRSLVSGVSSQSPERYPRPGASFLEVSSHGPGTGGAATPLTWTGGSGGHALFINDVNGCKNVNGATVTRGRGRHPGGSAPCVCLMPQTFGTSEQDERTSLWGLSGLGPQGTVGTVNTKADIVTPGPKAKALLGASGAVACCRVPSTSSHARPRFLSRQCEDQKVEHLYEALKRAGDKMLGSFPLTVPLALHSSISYLGFFVNEGSADVIREFAKAFAMEAAVLAGRWPQPVPHAGRGYRSDPSASGAWTRGGLQGRHTAVPRSATAGQLAGLCLGVHEPPPPGLLRPHFFLFRWPLWPGLSRR